MAKGKGKGNKKHRKSEPSVAKEILKNNAETDKDNGLTNLKKTIQPVLNPIANERKLPITENVEDEKIMTKDDEVTKLKTLNQHLLNTIIKERQDREELKNKLKESDDEAHVLHAKIIEDEHLLNTCKEDFETNVEGLQNELNETRILSQKHDELCSQLRQEKDELEDKLIEFNDAIHELHDKMAEERCRWDTYEEKISGLNNKLETVTQERDILNQKHEELFTIYRNEKSELEKANDENKKLKEMMTENQHLWRSSMELSEGKFTELKHELNDTRKSSEKHRELCTQLEKEKLELENKLKESDVCTEELNTKLDEEKLLWDTCKAKWEATVAGLQNELNEIRISSEKHREVYAQLEEDKLELENKLKESGVCTKKLNTKLAEEKCLWDTCNEKLEAKVAGLQNELNEIRKSSEKHQELYTQLEEEKLELENKLKESDVCTKKLNTKLTEEKCLWDTCKVKLEATVAGLQNELNETRVLREEHEKLCNKLRQEKEDLENKLKCQMKEFEAVMAEGSCFLDTCKTNFEDKVEELQSELNEMRKFSDNNKELCTQLKKERIELENKLKEYNKETKELKTKMTNDRLFWFSCKENLEGTVAGLENELNETKILKKEHEELCNQINQEKSELEYKLKERNKQNRELKAKNTEDRLLWDSCKENLESTVEGLQNELHETRVSWKELEISCTQMKQEKAELEFKLRENYEKTKELEGRIIGIEKELIETKILSQRRAELHTSLRQEKSALEKKVKEYNAATKKLQETMDEDACYLNDCKRNWEDTVEKLENELNETRSLSDKHKKLCTQLTQEKDELENKMKKCYDGNKKLNAKLTGNERLRDTSKGKLEGAAELLKNELNEKGKFSQEQKKLCTQLRLEKIELEKKLKKCNDTTKALHAKMTEDERLWGTCKLNLEKKVAGLETELNDIRISNQENEELFSQLRQENFELENKLKEHNEEIKERQVKLTENGHGVDSCKENWDGRVTELQNKLNDTRMLSQKHEELCTQLRKEKIQLEIKLRKCYDGNKKLNERKNEDQQLWETCNKKLESTVAGLKDELNENIKLCTQLELEKIELKDMLKDCIDRNKELHAKMTEERFYWDICNQNLENKVSGLQNELCEIRILKQENEELCTRLKQENFELENKLKQCNEDIKELKVKMTNDSSLWSSCNVLTKEKIESQNNLKECEDKIKELNAKLTEDGRFWAAYKEKFEGKLAGWQYEARILSQEHEDFCTHLSEEKNELQNKLKDCNEERKKLHAKMTEDDLFWNTYTADLERTVAGLKNELEMMAKERRILCQKYEDLCIESEFLKEQLGGYNVTLNSVEDERLGLPYLSASSDKKLEDLYRENAKQEIRELQNKLDMWTREGNQSNENCSSKDGARKLITSLSKSQYKEEKEAFNGNLKSHITLPPEPLFSGCSNGWYGGIV